MRSRSADRGSERLTCLFFISGGCRLPDGCAMRSDRRPAARRASGTWRISRVVFAQSAKARQRLKKQNTKEPDGEARQERGRCLRASRDGRVAGSGQRAAGGSSKCMQVEKWSFRQAAAALCLVEYPMTEPWEQRHLLSVGSRPRFVWSHSRPASRTVRGCGRARVAGVATGPTASDCRNAVFLFWFRRGAGHTVPSSRHIIDNTNELPGSGQGPGPGSAARQRLRGLDGTGVAALHAGWLDGGGGLTMRRAYDRMQMEVAAWAGGGRAGSCSTFRRLLHAACAATGTRAACCTRLCRLSLASMPYGFLAGWSPDRGMEIKVSDPGGFAWAALRRLGPKPSRRAKQRTGRRRRVVRGFSCCEARSSRRALCPVARDAFRLADGAPHARGNSVGRDDR